MINSKQKFGGLKTKQIEEDRKEAVKALIANKGIFKGKGRAKTDDEWLAFREQASEELIKHYEKKFGIRLR
ncbi:MAG: hypothetical protein HYW50_04120 [Candidatus Diapherotrites archaeon]|nr:hypothetical protein [Candidatus Diapherotrites archaeon]